MTVKIMTLWNGRLDSADDTSHFRIFQSVNQSDDADVGIIGYAIDKGVALNKGRIGGGHDIAYTQY
ncbi:hypothetical protein BHM04_07880 [Macrococcus sp. IME1552]|nr:hypothetical protein BHM04_07880 [Macrococcus sp. IME1552]